MQVNYDPNGRITTAGNETYTHLVRDLESDGVVIKHHSRNATLGNYFDSSAMERTGEGAFSGNVEEFSQWVQYRNVASNFPFIYNGRQRSDIAGNVARVWDTKQFSNPLTDVPTESVSGQSNYSFDQNDRLTQATLTYNNQLTFSQTSSSGSYQFPQGSNGNVSQYNRQIYNPVTGAVLQRETVATYDSQDRLKTLRGAINRTFTYTDDGDLESVSNCFGKKEFKYDIFGNLKEVKLPSGKVITYKVDGFNRRVARYVNGQPDEYYIWLDQTTLLAVLDQNKNPKIQYVYDLQRRAPSYLIYQGREYKMVANLKGDIMYVVDDEGSVVQEIVYDEYGIIMKDSSMKNGTGKPFQPLGYASGLRDYETGLVRFGARDYDPSIGRWTTKDPIGFAGGDTNLYSYVGQNPVTYVDPSGLSSLEFDSPGGLGTLLVYPGEPGTYGPPQAFPAGNITVNPSGDSFSAGSRGPLSAGTYPMERYADKSFDSLRFGSGIFYIEFPNRPGVGVHAGRKGPSSKTEGCIRTTENALDALRRDPPTSIYIGR